MKRIFGAMLLVTVLVLAHANRVSAQTPFPYFENVENGAAAEANWVADGDTTWVVTSAAAHSGNSVWALPTDIGSNVFYLTLASPLDLSASVNPTLSFWAQVWRSDITLSIGVSTDGGTTWETLVGNGYNNLGYGTANSEWTEVQVSLANFRQPNVLVRIGGNVFGNDNRFHWIDDILIDDAPPVGGLVLLDPTNHSLRLSWPETQAADFRSYRIVLSTDRNATTLPRPHTESPRASVVNRIETRVFDVLNRVSTDTTITDLVFFNTRYFARIYEEDTQRLWNLGSEVAQSQTLFEIDNDTAPLIQDFESGRAAWAADLPWALTENAAGEGGHSATRAWEDSPIGSAGSANYPEYADRWLVGRFDLSTVDRPALRFNQRFTFEPGSDWGVVSYSTNLTNWTELTRFTGSQAFWKEEAYDLGALANQDVAFLRFQVTSGSNGIQRDGWHLDDVEIFDIAAGQGTFPFFDDVENTADSEAKWISGDWKIASAAAHSGNQVWALPTDRGSNIWYMTLKDPLDLSASVNPTLSFWAQVWRSDITLNVGVSTDGGTTWETLVGNGYNNLGYGAANSEWTEVQVSLANFRQPNVLVRIGGNVFGNDNRFHWIDDISIDNPPSPIGTGDVDGNGVIDLADAVLILRHLAGFITLGGNGAAAADVSGNGTISPYDAVLILQYVAEIITEFPAAGKAVPGDAALAWDEPRVDGETGVAVLPLRLEGSGAINSVQLVTPFDAGQVAVEEVAARLPDDWQVFHRIESGELRVVMAGASPIDSGELARIKVRLLQPGSAAELGGVGVLDEGAPVRLETARLGRLPAGIELRQNFPNPFNPTTQIQYRLDGQAPVRLTVYNLVGQEVRTLVDAVQGAGAHAVEWDGRDRAGQRVESGVYLYRLETGKSVESKKMILVQ